MTAAAPRTACAPTLYPFLWASRVATILEVTAFDLTDEKATQAGIEAALRGAADWDDGELSREHRLGAADIPDFFIKGAVVLEVKGPRHRAPAVLRQLERYAAYPQVQAILLATARAMRMPAKIGGKPCRVINLGRAWL